MLQYRKHSQTYGLQYRKNSQTYGSNATIVVNIFHVFYSIIYNVCGKLVYFRMRCCLGLQKYGKNVPTLSKVMTGSTRRANYVFGPQILHFRSLSTTQVCINIHFLYKMYILSFIYFVIYIYFVIFLEKFVSLQYNS